MDYTTLSLPQILAEAEAIAVDVDTTYGGLGPEQLNWKPTEPQWSIGQCLDHLLRTDAALGRTLDGVITGTKRGRLLERVPLLPAMYGRLMVRSLGPTVPRTFKAPAIAVPSASAIAADVVLRFLAHHDQTVERIRALESRDPANVVITSPFAGGVVYSALDACRLLVAHDRRHMAQAQRVMAAPGFPHGGLYRPRVRPM